MQKPENQPVEPTPAPEEKHNLTAKLLIGVGLGGFIGGKLAIPGLVMDANNLFPKGTPLGTKFKQVFSKEVFQLIHQAVQAEMDKGRGKWMAGLVATKWSMGLWTIGTVALSVIGWNRADRIRDSKDIVKHPWKSTKIILGLQEPDPAPVKEEEQQPQGKYTAAIKAERAAQAEAQTQR